MREAMPLASGQPPRGSDTSSALAFEGGHLGRRGVPVEGPHELLRLVVEPNRPGHAPVLGGLDLADPRLHVSDATHLDGAGWDGLCVTADWLRAADPRELALLCLASLSAPLWLQAEEPDAGGAPLPLAELLRPLSGHPAAAAWDGTRLREGLARARHLRRWLHELADEERASTALAQLVEVVPPEGAGFITHTGLQFRAAHEVTLAQAERSVIAGLAFELRWASGAPADLPARDAAAVDGWLRASLRETDVVGRLDDHVYLGILPGQSPEEALIPAQRLMRVSWDRILPEGSAGLRLAVGLGARGEPPTDGLAFLREADLALRCGEPGEVLRGPATGALTADAPLDDAILRPRARLVDAAPGLFRSPIPDRRLEGVLRVLCRTVPAFQPARGRLRARYGDAIASLTGGVSLLDRRILWRACLLSDLGRALQGGPRAPTHAARQDIFRRIGEACPGLRPEVCVLADATRHLVGPRGSRLRRGGGLYRLARILEIADAFVRLAFEDGEGLGGQAGRRLTLAEIRDSLASGAQLRYDGAALGIFLSWLDVHGPAELAYGRSVV